MERKLQSAGRALLIVISLATSLRASEPNTDEMDWAKEQKFWAFRPPARQLLPTVQNRRWPAQRLDFFVLSRLEQKGLAPSRAADRRTLIRRVTYDLTGLPPVPSEVDVFVNDRHPDAYLRLVDRLLGSSGFGERLASLWLPLARYAEDQAHQVGSDTKFFYPNAYHYREWVIGAFNQDLPYDQFLKLQLAADLYGQTEHLPALGLLGLGPKYYNRGRIEVMADEWEDRVDTVTRTMLGLTVACARCHDHKFEPVTMRDYYALAGVFASTKMVNKSAAGKVEPAEPKAEQMGADTLHIVEEGEPQDLPVFIRGNVERKGSVVPRRFLQLFAAVPFREGSGRRELAECIAANPLTARVMVNRIWGHLMGRPLVATPSNFGHSGQPPTHPQLLDDLAAGFMAQNWSLKALIREIVLSSTYRQSSAPEPRQALLDPDNQWMSRMNRRRLSVEQWRDAALAVAGELERQGGKSLELNDPANRRRTVYSRVSRLKLHDFLMQFDYPDANVHAEQRATTTTPMQKLFLLNNPFVLDRAGALAARVSSGSLQASPEQVRAVYLLLFAREPRSTELELALGFLNRPGTLTSVQWEHYGQMLLASNEMWYVD